MSAPPPTNGSSKGSRRGRQRRDHDAARLADTVENLNRTLGGLEAGHNHLGRQIEDAKAELSAKLEAVNAGVEANKESLGKQDKRLDKIEHRFMVSDAIRKWGLWLVGAVAGVISFVLTVWHRWPRH